MNELTPPHWRHVKLLPDGRRFRIVTAFASMPITATDLALMRAGPRSSGLTKIEALKVGALIDQWIGESILAAGKGAKRKG